MATLWDIAADVMSEKAKDIEELLKETGYDQDNAASLANDAIAAAIAAGQAAAAAGKSQAEINSAANSAASSYVSSATGRSMYLPPLVQPGGFGLSPWMIAAGAIAAYFLFFKK